MDQFVRIGEHFIHVGAISSFVIHTSGTGDLRLFNGQAIAVEPRDARVLAEYLTKLSADLRTRRDFASGAYPTLAEVYAKRPA